MPNGVLLVGLTDSVLQEASKALNTVDVTMHTATSLDDVRTVLAGGAIHTVIVGGGLDLDTRLAVVRHIFETSNATTVHLKDHDSGAAGFLPFADSILAGLRSGS